MQQKPLCVYAPRETEQRAQGSFCTEVCIEHRLQLAGGAEAGRLLCGRNRFGLLQQHVAGLVTRVATAATWSGQACLDYILYFAGHAVLPVVLSYLAGGC